MKKKKKGKSGLGDERQPRENKYKMYEMRGKVSDVDQATIGKVSHPSKSSEPRRGVWGT